MVTQKRPKIRPPRRNADRVLEAIAIIALMYGIVEVCLNWSTLPQQIPTHFNASGQADGWGPKGMIWLLPALSVVMIPALLFLRRFPWMSNVPIRITEENALHQYGLIVRLLSLLACIVSLLFLDLLMDTIAIAGGGTSFLGSLMLPIFIVPVVGCILWYFIAAIRSA